MKLRIKGKTYIYNHECSPEQSGNKMTRDDMQTFVTDCLIESFELKGVKCIRHTPDFNSEADFSYNKAGETVCGVVKYIVDQSEGERIVHELFLRNFETEFPRLTEGFYKHGSVPIFFFAEAKCLDNDKNIPIAGGSFEITYHPLQMLYEDIPTKGGNMSEYDMYKGYAESWCSDDLSFIRDYVATFFGGTSELAFDEITSKKGLIKHIEHQHKRWKIRHTHIWPVLVKDTDTGKKGILIQSNGEDVCFVTLDFFNYRISRSHTFAPPKNYVLWEKAYELYQTHGDHHAPFVGDEELRSFLSEMMKDSTVCLTTDTDVSFDKGVESLTRVASLKYIGDRDIDDMGYLALIAYNPAEETNEFISCYPYLQGKSILVEVVDVLEWDNQIEATIKCKYSANDEDFVFHFFATDYYFNKEQYKIGAKLNIGLAASSSNVKEASHGFKFEGQKAVDFLAKIGKEPSYDENGEIEPVNFSTENLIAFIPHDSKCPDMAEFQSPTREFKYDSFWGNSVNTCLIKLNTDTGIEVPLYFNDDFEPKNGEPITGWLWLTGRLSDSCNTMHKSAWHMAESIKLAKVSENFLNKLCLFKTRYLTDVSELLNGLPDLSIESGEHLFIIKVGNRSRFDFEFFVANFSEVTTIISKLDPEGFLSGDDADKLLTPLEDSIIGNTTEAVWQLFLLSIGDFYLPYSKTHSSEFSYILTKDDAERSLKASNLPHSYINLLPSITKAKYGSGYFSVYVWDEGRLYRQVYTYHFKNGRIKFQLDAYYNVQKSFDFEDDYSDIRFRDGD